MLLSAVPALLLLPPVNCLIAACIGALLHRRPAGRALLALGLGGLVLFSLPVVGRSLIISLETGLRPTSQASGAPPQAIVILSGDQQPYLVSGYGPGPLTLERERAGAALARATRLPVLVTGGALEPWSPPLAAQMAISLQTDFGVPVRWQESASLNTWQNAQLSAAILRQQGITSIYLVTHAWHMRRALLAFRRAGILATAAPVGLDAPDRLSLAGFLPQAHAWEQSYYALHEWVGCAWYAIRG